MKLLFIIPVICNLVQITFPVICNFREIDLWSKYEITF